MAKCIHCVPDTVRKYSAKQKTPFKCATCGQRPAYWWGPNNNKVYFK